MISILTKPAVQFALQLGHGQLKNFFGKKIDEIVITKAQDKVARQIEKFIEEINRRTKIYFVWALLNILVLCAVLLFQNWWVSFFSLVFSFSILIFYIRSTLFAFVKSINFFENFESVLRQYIEEGFVEAKESGWQNKVALFFDSRDGKHYYRLVLEQVVRGISAWIADNRRTLYVRMALYVAATACFSISLREIFY